MVREGTVCAPSGLCDNELCKSWGGTERARSPGPMRPAVWQGRRRQLRGLGEDISQRSGNPPGGFEGYGLSSVVEDNSGWRMG